MGARGAFAPMQRMPQATKSIINADRVRHNTRGHREAEALLLHTEGSNRQTFIEQEMGTTEPRERDRAVLLIDQDGHPRI